MRSKQKNPGNEELVKGKYILYSSLEWRFLREMAMLCDLQNVDIPLVISPGGIRFVIRDKAQILQCEMKIGKDAFDFYEAIDCNITLDSADMHKIISRNGRPGQTIGFMIEPGHAYLSYEDEQYDITIIHEIGPGYLLSPESTSSINVPKDFLQAVIDKISKEDSLRMDNSQLAVGIGSGWLRISKKEGGAEVAWVVAGTVD